MLVLPYVFSGPPFARPTSAVETDRDGGRLKIEFDVNVPEVDGGISLKLLFGDNGHGNNVYQSHHISNSPYLFNLD